MTYGESVCVRCKFLYASTSAVCIDKDGKRNLISECPYGGKNAGNRKSCKEFRGANPLVIAERLKVLRSGGDGNS